MEIRHVHLVCVGYIILFHTLLIAAASTNGDTLKIVLSELEDLKMKVNTCEERLVIQDNKLMAATNEQRLLVANMEERLLAAEENLKTTEKLYEKKLAKSDSKLRAVERKLTVFEEMYGRLSNKGEPIEDVEETDLNVNTTDFDGENMKHSADEEKLAYLNGFHVSETVYDSTLGESLLTDTDNNHGNIRETNNIGNTRRSSTQKSERASDTIYHKRLLNPAVNHRVAFTAHVSVQVATELGKEHTIPFDQVLLNEGRAYDAITNTFICPVNGIYIFQSALMSPYKEVIQTEILKNGVSVGRMYANGGSIAYDQGFNSATVQCNKGDHVWVRVTNHYGTSVFRSNFPFSKRLLGVVVNHKPAFSVFLSDHVSGLEKEQTIPFDDVSLKEAPTQHKSYGHFSGEGKPQAKTGS
ncbi:uncharacterized protein LOC132746285 [Ruditapes philippinarum]|uniref:uncharacterized protein LOC132746285 n=1 Tax=Ruditapes philippinarum TaxID=129788 RepID=UPI00295B2AAD|nr:uncharacterized protein LOC132746285 [Ruditapes philippinarum]